MRGDFSRDSFDRTRHARGVLMQQGRVVLLRKGRPVDPDDFRGVYRIALPGHGEAGPVEDDED